MTKRQRSLWRRARTMELFSVTWRGGRGWWIEGCQDLGILRPKDPKDLACTGTDKLEIRLAL